ncbi:MAG: S-layer homology domain-containing protein [Clostridiaceae bacterium]
MKKCCIVLILCIALLMSPVAAEAADSAGYPSNTSYKGASAWALPELDKAKVYGLITDRIKENMSGNITREEFAEVIVKFYEIYTGKEAQTGNASFIDTTNPEILKAANLGLVQGNGDDIYAPYQLITREQMATILFRALKVICPDRDYSATGAVEFTDDSLINSWAREGVYYCSCAGITKGMENERTGTFKFDPAGNSSREAAVIVCKRAYELFMLGNAQANREDNVYNAGSSTDGEWSGGIIINDSEFRADEYAITEINNEDYIFLPYDRFKSVFIMPYTDYRYPETGIKDGKVTAAWKNKQGEINLEVIMSVGSPVVYINGQQGDITVGPYYKNDVLYVPINCFIELFSMKAEIFQGKLCLQYKDDFPQDILTGSWGYSNVSVYTGYKDIVTGLVSLPSFDFSYTFNSDGTYNLGMAGSGSYQQDALLLQTGKYRVIGNTIIFYDVYETLYKGSPLLLQYEKKYMGDRLEFTFIDDYDAEKNKIELNLSWYNRLQDK